MNRPINVVAILMGVLLLSIGCVTNTQRDIAEEYYNLANSYYELEEFDTAAELYGKALTINPQLTGADYNLAFAYIRLTQYENALRQLNQLLTQDPNNLLLQESVGYVELLQGNTDEAIRIYQEVLDQDPARMRILNNLALLWRSKRNYEEALSYYRRGYALAPDNSDIGYGYLVTLRDWVRRPLVDDATGDATTDVTSDATADTIGISEIGAIFTDTTSDATKDIPDIPDTPGIPDAPGIPDTTENQPTPPLQLTQDKLPNELSEDSTTDVTTDTILALARGLGNNQNITATQIMLVAEVFEEQEYYSESLTQYQRIEDESTYYPEALFRQAYILLTALDEVTDALMLVEEALEAGFRDATLLLSLYDYENLLQRRSIEALYQKYEIDVESMRASATPDANEGTEEAAEGEGTEEASEEEASEEDTEEEPTSDTG